MHKKTIRELSDDLKNKKFSSVELTQHYLDRIEKFGRTLNAFITVTPEVALQQAENADKQITAGTAGPLTGIPIAQKDIFCTKGIKTSCGSQMLDNFTAPYESTFTARCQNAGLVLLGKTNMDEFAMGSTNEHSFYGPVKNPWDITCVPGGSSGGSAAAVAARLTPLASGTDTGGSIRQPAAFCGISGLKPTYGRVSRFGMVAFASSLDQGGPMAHSAEDLAYTLNVISGHDPRDSTSASEAVPDFTKTLTQDIRGLKIGLPKEYFNILENDDIKKSLQKTINTFKALGAECINITLPNIPYAVSTYYVIASAECSSNLSRYDGVRYGYRCKNPTDLNDLYLRSRSEGLGKEVKRRIMMGTYALSSGYYESYYNKAQRIRRLIRDDFLNAFKNVDVILAPTTPTSAYKIGEKDNDLIGAYLSDIFTIPTNLAGLPALSLPMGLDVNQKPLGFQLIGPHFQEARLLNIGHQYQQKTDWHQATPKDF